MARGGGGGKGRRPVPPQETPPAPLSLVAAVGVGRVPGPEPVDGRSRCDSSAEGAGGAPDEVGVRALELPLRGSVASGARVFYCALPPLLAALRGPAPLQSQLLLPSTCEGGAQTGAGPGGPRPLPRRESRVLRPPSSHSGSLLARLRKLSKLPRLRAPSQGSAPPRCRGKARVPTARAGR